MFKNVLAIRLLTALLVRCLVWRQCFSPSDIFKQLISHISICIYFDLNQNFVLSSLHCHILWGKNKTKCNDTKSNKMNVSHEETCCEKPQSWMLTWLRFSWTGNAIITDVNYNVWINNCCNKSASSLACQVSVFIFNFVILAKHNNEEGSSQTNLEQLGLILKGEVLVEKRSECEAGWELNIIRISVISTSALPQPHEQVCLQKNCHGNLVLPDYASFLLS